MIIEIQAKILLARVKGPIVLMRYLSLYHQRFHQQML
jgi:hypothetical protein